MSWEIVTPNTITANLERAEKELEAYVEGLGSREPKKPTPPQQNPEASDSNTQPPAPSA